MIHISRHNLPTSLFIGYFKHVNSPKITNVMRHKGNQQLQVGLKIALRMFVVFYVFFVGTSIIFFGK